MTNGGGSDFDARHRLAVTEDGATAPDGGAARWAGGPTPHLAAALAKVQAELPKLDRDRTVTVEPKDPKKPPYSYSYVTLANLSEAILPLLAKHGLSFVAMPGAGADGKMCVRYHLMHESGEALTGEFPISGEGGIQMIGGRITYARRYCLAAIVGVAADEDDESRLSEEGTRSTAQRRQPEAGRQPASGKTAQRARQPDDTAGPPPLPGEEQPAAEPGFDRDKATREMYALWRNLGFDGDANRENRAVIMTKILGREVASSKDLSDRETQQVVSALRARKRELQQQSEGGGES